MAESKPVPVRREFVWAGQRLADPDPSLTPEQVRDLYASIYPELTSAAVQIEPAAAGVQVYSLEKPSSATVPAAAKQTVTFVKSQGSRG